MNIIILIKKDCTTWSGLFSIKKNVKTMYSKNIAYHNYDNYPEASKFYM